MGATTRLSALLLVYDRSLSFVSDTYFIKHRAQIPDILTGEQRARHRISAGRNCHFHSAAPWQKSRLVSSASGHEGGTDLSLRMPVSTPPDFTTQRERIEDALREIGTLLMTFAPLDAAINPSESGARLLIFFVIGLIVIYVGPQAGKEPLP